MQFKTKLEDACIRHEEIFLKEILKLDFNEIDNLDIISLIEWQFEFESRDWGVKNISAYATKISASINIDYYKGHFEFVTKEIDITQYIKDFEINSDLEEIEHGQICVSEIDFDFHKKEITITFN